MSAGSKHHHLIPTSMTEQLHRRPVKQQQQKTRTKGFSPATTLRVIWCLWSLNKPGISTRHPYIPESSSSTCLMVSDTSPSPRSPCSRYRSDSLLVTDVPSDFITMLAQPLLGMAPRPQHAGSFPSCQMSYLQVKVTSVPTVVMMLSADTQPETAAKKSGSEVQKTRHHWATKPYWGDQEWGCTTQRWVCPKGSFYFGFSLHGKASVRLLSDTEPNCSVVAALSVFQITCWHPWYAHANSRGMLKRPVSLSPLLVP